MKKNYAIIKNGELAGKSLDTELDPEFKASQEAEGFEFREIDESLLSDIDHLKLTGDLLEVDTAKKDKKDKKDAARLRLQQINLNAPLLDVEAVVKDILITLQD